MPTMTMEKVRAALGKTVSRVERRGDRILLRRRGKAVAALVPVEDLELIERLEDEIDVREAERILKDEAERPVPYEGVRRNLGLR